jgi:hypothetical protein
MWPYFFDKEMNEMKKKEICQRITSCEFVIFGLLDSHIDHEAFQSDPGIKGIIKEVYEGKERYICRNDPFNPST